MATLHGMVIVRCVIRNCITYLVKQLAFLRSNRVLHFQEAMLISGQVSPNLSLV